MILLPELELTRFEISSWQYCRFYRFLAFRLQNLDYKFRTSFGSVLFSPDTCGSLLKIDSLRNWFLRGKLALNEFYRIQTTQCEFESSKLNWQLTIRCILFMSFDIRETTSKKEKMDAALRYLFSNYSYFLMISNWYCGYLKWYLVVIIFI